VGVCRAVGQRLGLRGVHCGVCERESVCVCVCACGSVRVVVEVYGAVCRVAWRSGGGRQKTKADRSDKREKRVVGARENMGDCWLGNG
jgi:hypothetical protein